MAMFNSYVKLPEGRWKVGMFVEKKPWGFLGNDVQKSIFSHDLMIWFCQRWRETTNKLGRTHKRLGVFSKSTSVTSQPKIEWFKLRNRTRDNSNLQVSVLRLLVTEMILQYSSNTQDFQWHVPKNRQPVTATDRCIWEMPCIWGSTRAWKPTESLFHGCRRHWTWVSEGKERERLCLKNLRFQLDNSQIDGNMLGICWKNSASVFVWVHVVLLFLHVPSIGTGIFGHITVVLLVLVKSTGRKPNTILLPRGCVHWGVWKRGNMWILIGTMMLSNSCFFY